jgi:hypothetical protein
MICNIQNNILYFVYNYISYISMIKILNTLKIFYKKVQLQIIFLGI